MTLCVVCPPRGPEDAGHVADVERGLLCCDRVWRRMAGDLAAIPEVWLQLWSLGEVERDVREGTRAVLVDGQTVRVPAMADPVANVLTAGPARSTWSTSQVRSSRPERVPVSLDVVDVTGAVNHAARRLHTRAVLGLEPDQEGHLSAATVLHRWVLRWAARRKESEPRRLVGTMASWLRDRLDWACAHDELLGEFAEEIGELRRTLDGLAGNFPAPPERVDRPCPSCGSWALCHDRAKELIRCGVCERALTDDEYRDHLREVIVTNWTVVDVKKPPADELVWVRDDDLGAVLVGYMFDGRWYGTDGDELRAVSYWAPLAVPADPGPAKPEPDQVPGPGAS